MTMLEVDGGDGVAVTVMTWGALDEVGWATHSHSHVAISTHWKPAAHGQTAEVPVQADAAADVVYTVGVIVIVIVIVVGQSASVIVVVDCVETGSAEPGLYTGGLELAAAVALVLL